MIPKRIQPYLDIWNNANLRKHTEENTKIFRRAIRSLKELNRGKFFNDISDYQDYTDQKFVPLEFQIAVDNFSIATNDPGYAPYSKAYLKKLSLPDFLYDNRNTWGEPSLFIKYLENAPESIQPPITDRKDNYAEITNILVEYYKGYCKRRRYEAIIEVKEMNKFIASAERTTKFFLDNQDKLYQQGNTTPVEQANRICRTIHWIANQKGFDITPGTFCSNILFDKFLPQHLKRIEAYK